MEELYGAYIDAFAEMSLHIEQCWLETESEYPPNLNQTLKFFVQTMMSRARASFMLLQSGSYWESEIVLRSLLEATVKCATFARRKNVEQLLHEYWIELQASSDRKAALRASQAQELIPEGSTDRPIFETLQNKDFFAVEPRANKQRRRRLDQEWSLPELVRMLESEETATKPVAGLKAMLHSYGLQSEVTHVSSKYYDLLWDRVIRTDDLLHLENAHYCRQMADAIQLTGLCIFLSLERLGASAEEMKRPIEIANSFSKLLRPYRNKFDESQGFVSSILAERI